MIKYELHKVITKRLFWWTLVAALLVNFLALWWLNPPPDGLTHSEVKEVYDAIRALPTAEKLQYLEEYADEPDMTQAIFGVNWDTETWLVMQARSELASAVRQDLTRNTYAAYLDSIDERADILLNTAIFGNDPDSFSSRNIIKTQQDFSHMRDIQIRYDVNEGITKLFESPSTDIVILLLILLICFALITDEKDKRLFLLVKATPNGHIHTIAAKLTAMAVCIVGVSLLTFMSGVIFCELTYGLGDITRSVQSVPLLRGSVLRITVAEFMALHFVAKTAGMFCIGAAVMLIALHAKHSIILMAATVVFAAANVLLAAIPVVSSWNILRFLNFTTLIRPHSVFGSYFNLNVFGHPVRLTPVFIAFGAVVFIALCMVVCLSFVRKRGLESNHDLFKFNLPMLAGSRSNSVPSWRYFEFKKLAFVNKALLLLVAFCALQAYTIYSAEEPRLGFDHYYIKHTLNSLQGGLTNEKEAFLLSEKARYDQAAAEVERIRELMWGGAGTDLNHMALMDEMQTYLSILDEMQGFLVIYERYEYVRDTKHAEFLYDSGYMRLFGMRNSDAGLEGGTRLLTVLILSLCGLFAMEYKTGMYKVLNATAFGRQDTVRVKLLLSLALTFVAFIASTLPELVYIGRFFGYGGIDMRIASIAPVVSESGTIGFPAFMGGFPIWTYITFMLLARFVIFAGVMLIVSALSMKLRNNAYAALSAAGVLVLPLFLYEVGFTLLTPLSLLELITFNGLVVDAGIFKAVQLVAFAGVATYCGMYVIRRFGRA